MKLLVGVLTITALILTLGGFTKNFTVANEIDDRSTIWTEIKKILTFLMGKCKVDPAINGNSSNPKWHNVALILKDCLKRRGLRALDRALSRDIITITDNVVLIRRKNDSQLLSRYDRNEKSLKDSFSNSTWQNGLTNKLLYFLKTRSLQIKLPSFKTLIQQNEARHKHKQGGLGPMLMFGLVAAGLIVIPMGFQFLAVLGGKALLLAKLALILTSIQGLKKIATSQLNYGLYSTGHGGAWPYYDRKWAYDPYSSSSYYSGSGGVDTPVLDQYVHTSELPSFYPHTVTPRYGT